MMSETAETVTTTLLFELLEEASTETANLAVELAELDEIEQLRQAVEETVRSRPQLYTTA
jgi:hypothetical protein